uniref:Zeta toxin domain-containing protein n=1 Tax=Chromera velia CCMP2878 TaxID=1169474 RepID=A0A0G4HJX1_9ALVE|mmetsp:Transcript_52791/g.103227  ORF Transcript_52791/g.103227 Transcript_52791/m.103227 type:complete len:228 (+) Transcript_52791:156-839(+)|eukprot:Cvel_28313.t1-p1 / transcript=Cvel_28313.t1 / gene=Cvel_28313 / organism=Chromera_velia_CCMP2878 / gene_product=hypothetical protein / transcript_product=hypothetical protein / location=Cvel_scaffold3677:13387-14067(-) / protein_length=227 / sequence_SO=supercontig / SO=protein_coding / is_pseudo=false
MLCCPAAPPVLVLVSGPPGAGKSSLCARLSGFYGLVHLDKDELDEKVMPGKRDAEYRQNLEPLVLRDLLASARDLLTQGEGCILDAPWTCILHDRPELVQEIQTICSHANALLLVFELGLSTEVLYHRLLCRNLERDSPKLESSDSWRLFLSRDHVSEVVPLPHVPVDAERDLEDVFEFCCSHLGELIAQRKPHAPCADPVSSASVAFSDSVCAETATTRSASMDSL